jgi:hypothetical protein
MSSSFVNYTPSKERTANNVNAVLQKYGNDIAIIDGNDDWNGCIIFKISTLLNKFGIETIDSFHSGISGISKSGCVINKSDLSTFIKKFNKMKWTLRSTNYGNMFNTENIRIFDPAINEWQTFFEIKYGDTEYLAEKNYNEYKCRHKATCTINNFKPTSRDVSLYFESTTVKWYWHKVESFK